MYKLNMQQEEPVVHRNKKDMRLVFTSSVVAYSAAVLLISFTPPKIVLTSLFLYAIIAIIVDVVPSKLIFPKFLS